MGDRRQPVRDDERRRAVFDLPQRLLHVRFELRVERARRLVENQNLRPPQKRARDREPLPLSARQLDAAVADGRVVRAGQAVDELISRRPLGRRPDGVIVRQRRAVADVVADAAREQRRLLHDRGDLRAQPSRIERPDVVPSCKYPPLVGIVKAQQQVEQRRLARTRLPHNRDDVARRHVQIDAFQGFDVRPRRVPEPDAFKRDRSVERRRHFAAFERNARRLLDQVERPPGGADRAKRFGAEPRAVAQPARHEQCVENERQHRARRHPPLDDQAAADPDREQGREFTGQHRHAGERGSRFDLALRGCERARKTALEPIALGALLSERADRPDSREHFRRGGSRISVCALHLGGHRFHAAAEP